MPTRKFSARLTKSNIANPVALDFTIPILRENRPTWYIEFYAFDSRCSMMRRKRIKISKVSGVRLRRKYATALIKKITSQLLEGWNPWEPVEIVDAPELQTVLGGYSEYIGKMFTDNLIRESTYTNYNVQINKFSAYIEDKFEGIKLDRIDRQFCSKYLDYIYIDMQYSAQYRNNCLTFLKAFFNRCVSEGVIEENPTSGISPFSQKLCRKRRQPIPQELLIEISEYLQKNDKPFLLSCYLLFYCLIRPGEQVRLKIGNINFAESTITIPSEASKNHKRQTVTIPAKVMQLMSELQLDKSPENYYIFSSLILPGKIPVTRRMLSKHWDKVRKTLKIPSEYQFYSLKDTGITDMLKSKVSNIAVRDQARHSSLSITNIYASSINKGANAELVGLDCDF